MLFISSWLRITPRLFVVAALLCAMNGCGGPSHDIIGKWRTGDANAIVWEFFPNGAVLVGKDKGRYTFGDQKRIKIQTPFATSVYQMQIADDHMSLTSPSGLKLELTKIK
jgi:hypothetical protein